MLKKLTEEKQQEILNCAIHEFADNGLEKAVMSRIAASARISVGVLYKYYEDKDSLFLACVRYSTGELESFINNMISHEDKPLNYARTLIQAVQRYSKQNEDYIRLYHVITCSKAASPELAREIEGFTSRVYIDFLRNAQERGIVRRDLDPKLLALFFDNLLMMMQFSYCCPYYRERFKLYAGEGVLVSDELVAEQLLRFLESAFTLEHNEIKHSN